MLKKKLALIAAAVVIVGLFLIPPVRVAAESALSVFRVADAKTIIITAGDIQDVMTSLKNTGLLPAQNDGTKTPDVKTETGDQQSQLADKMKSDVKAITSVREFTAFPFNLPTSLKAETPKLYAVDTKSNSDVLDTAKINAQLSKLGATTLVDSSLNGATVTVSTPPAIIAEYSDVTLAATQNVYVDAPDNVISSLWSSLLSVPAIPDDLKTQLAQIDPKSHDIYLPVIEGLGRQTDIGSATGYIYSTSDLAQVVSAIPELAGSNQMTALQDKNASALIWTKDGVIYLLVGDKSDSELTQIAGSIN